MADVRGAHVGAGKSYSECGHARVTRKSSRRPPGTTLESLARIDELARDREMVNVTQADRSERRDRGLADGRFPKRLVSDDRGQIAPTT